MGMASSRRETLSPTNQGDEFLLMGLRLAEGIDPARFERLSGRCLDARRLQLLKDEHLVAADLDGRVRVTPAGFPLLDAIIAELAG